MFKSLCGEKVRLFLSVCLGVSISLITNTSFAESKSEKKPIKHEQITAGWLEAVILEPWNLKLRAKLDTGAKTSSLHAINIERFKRDGKKWVRFQTVDPEDKKPLPAIEAPLVRDVKIKRHKVKAQLRPVVEMTLCLSGQVYESEFSLIDRGRFNYQVLLGRRMLQQGIIVDPASTFTLKTSRKECRKALEALNKPSEKSPTKN